MKKIFTAIALLFILCFTLLGCSGNKADVQGDKNRQGNKVVAASSGQNIKGDLKITMLNVGKADAILLQLNGKNVLIDTGLRENGNDLVKRLRVLGVDKIDMLFFTHPHADHIGGGQAVLNSLKVLQVYDTNVVNKKSKLYPKIIKLIEDKGIKRTTLIAPTTIELTKDAKFEVLWPEKEHITVPGDANINPNSLVMRFVYKNFAMMFTADSYKQSEAEIIAKYPKEQLLSQVLKVAHHSSNTSTSTEWLHAVNPKIGLISCGIGKDDKPDKYPNKTTLKRLQTAKVKTYNTKASGNITLVSDGEKYSIQTEK